MADAVPDSNHPLTPEARLDLARRLEERHRHGDALLAYYRAIIEAQRQGRWLDKGTTAPELVSRVSHAMRYGKAGRRRAFEHELAPVYERHGREALRRFEDCLAMQVGEHRAQPDDARQKPSMLYFPGLPATPYYLRAEFPWLDAFERKAAAIREELLDVMPQTERSERVFASDEAERRGLAGGDGAPAWQGFYFYRHGLRREENHALCPRTSAALAALPLVHIRGNAPEVMFSVLTPGTHILPHRGVTNTRVVCHLPLVVPEGCALIVGGERHEWREGVAVLFDDTYEHEAWNRGSETRVVLIADVWNPNLTAAEREAVSVLAGAMTAFNEAAGV
ncbi:MAG: aspartyl/asparaginyl beta-hydroxylase domain-containing protein [Steroidobacteraceae bacterium]